MLRVGLIASSPLVRAGLHAALDQAGGFEVLRSAASLGELASDPPSGVEVIIAQAADEDAAWLAQLPGEGWPPLVLLLEGEARAVGEWLAEGVTVLASDAGANLVAAAASAAAAGLVAGSREMISDALRFARTPRHEERTAPGLERLTARETEVLAQLAQGLGNKAIAQALHISTHTAKFHVAQIISKLDASSRAHAVAKALRAGLIEA